MQTLMERLRAAIGDGAYAAEAAAILSGDEADGG
jgi:hypothetical protein